MIPHQEKPMTAIYDQDFHAWTQEQAAMLRAGRFTELDIEHLAEELDSMGARERRELTNRLAVLLAHLLKWQHQPERRGNSWRLTVEVQRLDLQDLLNQNPSLRPQLSDRMRDAYRKAVLLAAQETGIPKGRFTAECPYTQEQVMNGEFWPENPEPTP
jgi:hypothetical protein